MNKRVISHLQMLFIFSFLIVCILIIHGQVVCHDFMNVDDGLYVTKNYYIQSGFTFHNFILAFTTTIAANWHPLTFLSLILDYELYGLNAGGYHFTNLLLHLANTFLLFFLLKRMTGSVGKSCFVAALFALHPLHVESVAWVSARKDVLSTFFWLLTIWAYYWYVTRPEIKRYCFVLMFFVFGLMAKPMVVTLPFVLLLLDYWPFHRYTNDCTISKNNSAGPLICAEGGAAICDNKLPSDNACLNVKRKTSRFIITEKIPLLILSSLSCVVTYEAQKHAGAVQSAEAFPFAIRLTNAIVSYASYIEKTFWPGRLSAFYPHPGMWPLTDVLLSGSLLIIISLCVLCINRRYPYMAVGWLWFLGTLVPVIGIVQVGNQAMADRYTYVPLTGLFIMMAWSVPDIMKRLPYRNIILAFGFALIVIVLTVISSQRCQLWGDNVALWEDALKNYRSAFTYNIRGLGYADKGQYHEAIDDFKAALEIQPDYAEAIINRADVYGVTGQYKQALADFSKALKIKPDFADAYYNRGIVHLAMNRLDLAINDFTTAINIEPDMADAFNNRGVVFLAKKEYQKAFIDFTQAVKINRNHAHAYYNRGRIYNIYQQYDAAIEEFNQALKIKPDFADAVNNLRITLNRKKLHN